MLISCQRSGGPMIAESQILFSFTRNSMRHSFDSVSRKERCSGGGHLFIWLASAKRVPHSRCADAVSK